MLSQLVVCSLPTVSNRPQIHSSGLTKTYVIGGLEPAKGLLTCALEEMLNTLRTLPRYLIEEGLEGDATAWL